MLQLLERLASDEDALRALTEAAEAAAQEVGPRPRLSDSDVLQARISNPAVLRPRLSDSDVLQIRLSDSDVLQLRLSDSDVLQFLLSDSDVLQVKLSDSDVLQIRLRQRFVLRALEVLAGRSLSSGREDSAQHQAVAVLSAFAGKDGKLLALLAALVRFLTALQRVLPSNRFKAMSRLAADDPETMLALTRLASEKPNTLTALVKLV